MNDMGIRIKETTISSIKNLLEDYFYNDIRNCDDYFESIILDSDFYEILDQEKIIGFFAKTDSKFLSCYYLIPGNRMFYEKILDNLLESSDIKGILAITSDKMLITEIIRRGLKINNQAFNFKHSKKVVNSGTSNFTLRKATSKDLSSINSIFKDFLENYQEKIDSGDLYLGILDKEIISLGNVNHHLILEDTVSIGLIVKEDLRNKGYGMKTIKKLVSEYKKKNKKVNAGCWIKNYPSKAALLNSGFIISGILIYVDEL